MSCILLNDCYNIFRYFWKFIAIYLFCMVSYIAFSLMTIEGELNHIIFTALGMKFNYERNIDVLMFAVSNSFYLAVYFYIFLIDFKLGVSNIFARLKPQRYVIYKLVSIFIFIMLLKLFFHILATLICKMEIISIFYYLKDILSSLMICLFVIICYMIGCKTKKNVFIIFPVVLFIVGLIDIKLYSVITHNIFLVSLIDFILIIIYFKIRNFIIDVYERSR